jgi:hypothetical protein
MIGTPADPAASIARPMFARLRSGAGSVIGSAPSKYSFWTSITIRARFGIADGTLMPGSPKPG